MNNRTIIIVCFIILIAGATNWLMDQNVTRTEPEDPSANDPDLYMLDADITRFDDTGEIQHKLRASRFTHFPVNDITTLEHPNLDLFSDDDGPWNIAARNGRLLPESTHDDQLVELWDHVIAVKETRTGDFINIQTESLFIFPRKDYAETDQKVYIDDDSGRTTAAGMEAWFGTGRFHFYSQADERVNTVLQPGRFPD